MIGIKIIENVEGDYAIYKKVVTFFGLPIYKLENKTTSESVVNQFKVKHIKKIKGFKNEN